MLVEEIEMCIVEDIDIRNRVFKNEEVENIDYERIEFSNCKFIDCKLEGNLQKVVFSECKFENCDFIIENEMPVVTDGMCGYLICDLVQTVDCGTHDIFIGRVTNTKKLSNNKEMTYRYYHEVIKAIAPKNAPTYIGNDSNAKQNEAKYAENSNNETTNSNMKYEKYKCIICGYIYDESIEKIKFTDLPDDWKCPRCGVGKENFVKID